MAITQCTSRDAHFQVRCGVVGFVQASTIRNLGPSALDMPGFKVLWYLLGFKLDTYSRIRILKRDFKLDAHTMTNLPKEAYWQTGQ